MKKIAGSRPELHVVMRWDRGRKYMWLANPQGVQVVSRELLFDSTRREPRIARYTNEDAQLAYAGDRFFELVPKIAGYMGKWGGKSGRR